MGEQGKSGADDYYDAYERQLKKELDEALGPDPTRPKPRAQTHSHGHGRGHAMDRGPEPGSRPEPAYPREPDQDSELPQTRTFKFWFGLCAFIAFIIWVVASIMNPDAWWAATWWDILHGT